MSFKRHRVRLISLAFVAALTAQSARGQTIHYVDVNAGGTTHNGSSWCTAFVNPQDALAIALAGDEIRVADGTYRPDRGANQLAGDRDASFSLTTGVVLRGGYAGCGASNPNEQDFIEHETILSGDLAGNDGPGFTNMQENSFNIVISHNNAVGGPTLDGFTVTGGRADGLSNLSHDRGAGLSAFDGIHVSNCKFVANWAKLGGGGMRSGTSNPSLTNCTFVGNWGVFGAGWLHEIGGSPTAADCLFADNVAERAGGGMYYIGRNQTTPGRPRVTNCTFVGNRSDGVGGGVFNSVSDGTFIGCLFRDNFASTAGGGIENRGGGSPTLAGCVFLGNGSLSSGGGFRTWGGSPMLINCLFSGNSVNVHGGGMANFLGSPTLVNCTFSANRVNPYLGAGGGLWSAAPEDGDATITNSVFWGNEGQTDATEEDAQVFVYSGAPAVDHTCIQGLTGILGGAGNIGENPVFVDANGPDETPGTDDDDLQLSPGSPCIDAGDTLAYLAAATPGPDTLAGSDLNGRPRLLDIFSIPDAGVGDFPPIDMGSFEHATDCNGNATTDVTDIAIGDSRDCNANTIPDECEADCNGNEIADACDVATGSAADCNSNGLPDGCDLVAGLSEDCNANAVPDECDADCNFNLSPDECDLTLGTSLDSDDDGIPDECPVRKNRYISFMPQRDGKLRAFFVTLIESELFGGYGPVGWVDAPDADGLARLTDKPVFRDWSGDRPLISVGDCAIVPGALYLIQYSDDGTNFSTLSFVSTIAKPGLKTWGDVAGAREGFRWTPPDGSVNVNDVLASLQTFLERPGAPPVTWIDLDGERPNGLVNVTDVQLVLLAFQGRPYPFLAPADCP